MGTKSYIGRLPCNSRSLGARAISQCTWTLRAPHTSRARVCFLIYIYTTSRHGMMTRKWDYIVVLICGVISWKCLPVPAEYHDCREFQKDEQLKQRLPNIEDFCGCFYWATPEVTGTSPFRGRLKIGQQDLFDTYNPFFISMPIPLSVQYCIPLSKHNPTLPFSIPLSPFQSHSLCIHSQSHSFECRIFF